MSLTFTGVEFGYGRGAPPVLRDFSWQVPSGRTVLLGPNGAGKSTLLALGASAIRPKRGRVSLGALDPRHHGDRAAFRRAVGWVPQQARAVPGLSAREQVAYAGWLKGLSGAAALEEADRALADVGLSELAGQQTTRLSGGQLRRVGLAQALVHDPKLLLLDEPTAGLDPDQRARFRDLLLLAPADRPVVVSTHQVDDLSELFDTVVVLQEGRIRFSGTVAEFLEAAPAGASRSAEAAYSRIAAREQ